MNALQQKPPPPRARPLWFNLLLAYLALLFLTAMRSWLLSGRSPNPLHYMVYPLVIVLVEGLAIWLGARLFQKPVEFPRLLLILLVLSIAMLFVEVSARLVYYLAWQYPPIVYVLWVFLPGVGLTAYALKRFTNQTWSGALILAILGFTCYLFLTLQLNDRAGLFF